MKIAILIPDNTVREMFIPDTARRALEAVGTLTWNEKAWEPENLAALLADAEVCITGWGCPSLDESIIKDAKNLKLVAHTGGSAAGIYSPYLYDKGVRVISGNLLFAESVAEGTLAYMLAGQRRIPQYSKRTEKGEWNDRLKMPTNAVMDKKVSLIGFGAIARFLVPMLKPLRAVIKVYDPYISDELCREYGVTRVSILEEAFTGADIISLHLAQQPETFHLINKDLIDLIPDGALLVNTSRGSVIDEAALAEALKTGRFRAVLDVYEKEPLPMDSPLRGLPNVTIIPHQAGPTTDQFCHITITLAEEIKNFQAGKPMRMEISKEYAAKMTTM